MTTTVKRLRIAARHDHSQGRMMNEAADLIEQKQELIEGLISEIRRLQKLLDEIRNGDEK